MWEAVSYDGVPYGVPHQTDVSALLVNLDMLEAAGIDTSTLPDHAGRRVDVGGVRRPRRAAARGAARRQVPVRLQLAARRRPALAELAVPGRAAHSSTRTASPRRSTPPEGQKALDYTKSFFDNNWVPPTSSPKATTYADSLFAEQTTAMAFVGSFLVPDMDYFNEFEWTSVPMPRDVRGATDLGGNALVATAGTDNPDLAAEFLKFMASGRGHDGVLRRAPTNCRRESTSSRDRSSSPSAPT